MPGTKLPMYEMPPNFVFGVLGNFFCIGVLDVGVLTFAFCAEISCHKHCHYALKIFYLKVPIFITHNDHG